MGDKWIEETQLVMQNKVLSGLRKKKKIQTSWRRNIQGIIGFRRFKIFKIRDQEIARF